MTIYKIINKINNKIYIGKTIRDPKIRWQEHIQYSRMPSRYDTPLYKAIRKYGIENFEFQILEDNINSEEELNNKEQEYIIKYNSLSHDLGYNVALGGDGGRISSKLSESQVKEIINILSDKNNLQSLSDIGKQFNISASTIGSINRGTTWHDSSINYPIRKYCASKISIDRATYQNIVHDIKHNTNLSLQEIADKYEISESCIESINYGKYCYNKDNEYYKGIYNENFPIREIKRTEKTLNEYVDIFYDVLFTNNSLSKIGMKYNIPGNSIQYVISGKRRKELTKDFLLPMRNFIEENKIIFMQLYPNYDIERSDALYDTPE